VPSNGSRRAAVIAGEGREDLQKTVEDRDAERRGIPLLNWAFTTIHDVLLPSALPLRPSGTDRGRQTASQRITGGLVSHWQAKARPAGVAGSQGGLFLVGDLVS
jgi:hypothetical protein